MADAPDYKKGPVQSPGMGDQLPQGGATQLNEGVQIAQEMADQNQQPQAATNKSQETGSQQPEEFQPQPVEYAQPPKGGPQLPGNESDEALFGPTDRPNEPVTAGRVPPGFEATPDHVIKILPALREAAKDPDAPPMIRAMLQLLVYHSQQGS